MKIKNPVVWFEIYVDEIERAKTFYEKVLSINLNEIQIPELPDGDNDMRMLGFPMEMNGEGACGALVKMKGMKPGGNSTVIYFGSDDCSIEEAKIEQAGGKVVQSKQSIGAYGFMVLANDTEGNMIGIYTQA